MTTARRSDTLRDQNRVPIPGALISVIDYAGNAAVLKNDDASNLANPFETDGFGGYAYNTTPGRYTERFTYGGRTVADERDVIVGTIIAAVDPSPANAGKFVALDGAGVPVFASGTGNDSAFRTDVAASGGSALVGFLQSGTGSVSRPVQDKLRDLPINVTEFGVSTGNSGATNNAKFALAIAAANAQGRLLYLPQGRYPNTGSLPVLTGPGLIGDGEGLTIIDHYSPDTCITTKGAYKQLRGFSVVNKVAPSTATGNQALILIQNCVYGDFRNLYTYHDLTNYAGIQLEQVYDGSADDATMLVHYGCWYNHFANIKANYSAVGANAGIGVYFRVNANAIGVVNPTGQPAGTYTGQCSYNVIDLPNIEQRDIGLKIDRGVGNHVRGGQFINCNTQVQLRNSSNNLFVGTKHNQWATEPFNTATDGTCQRNVILYPILFNLTAQPWSIGTVDSTTVVVRSDTNGTWTPVLKFGGTIVPLTKAGGQYSMIDGLVSVTYDIQTGVNTGTGPVTIEGLPFNSTPDNVTTNGVPVSIISILSHGASPATASGNIATGYTQGSKIITGLMDYTQALTNAHFGNGARLTGTLTYFAQPL